MREDGRVASTASSGRDLEVRSQGLQAALVEVGDTPRALALAQWVRHRVGSDVEVVPGARTVLVDGVDPAGVSALVGEWPGEHATADGPLVTLGVRYDGPDLLVVAEHWGCTTAEVVERHQRTTYTSAFTGFAPGFAYLAGLPEELRVPRLASPRPRVPAGSVALADTWCGIYPGESPGGWLLIGRVEEELWDATRDQPALLSPGTQVRFVAR